MAGLCGIVGEDHRIEAVADDLEWTGEETTTRIDSEAVSVVGSFTPGRGSDQPVSVDGARIWVWGSIFGVEHPTGYRPRDATESTTAAYCATLYDQYGRSFVSRLNGDFVVLIDDHHAETVWIATDRLGLRDIYYVKPTADTVVFSTAIQSLSRHPAVTPAFDIEYVTEYLACDFRTFGLKTPLQDTFLFPPGALTAIDTDTAALDSRSYWTPRHEPIDRSFSYFLEEFTDRFAAAVRERLHAGRSYGLLLSGGADSRLILAAADESARERLTAYHMAGWWSREARTADAVAATAGVDFEWLERDASYHERALERNPSLSNFVGTFEQAHAEGFMPDVRDDIDAMATANFADSTFKGYSFPKYQFRLDPVGTLTLPVFKPMDGIDRYLDYWLDAPAYLSSPVDARDVLESEIFPVDDGVAHHGIHYGSPAELFTCASLTPRTNGSVLFTLQSIRQHVPAWSPFVDNRLIDLYLSMPLQYFARRNIVRRAIERLDPALAGLRDANTGVSVAASEPVHFVGDLLVRFRDKYDPRTTPPEPHLSHRPWPDMAALVRDDDFVWNAIRDNEAAIRELPFLDWEGVRRTYQRHLSRESLEDELYGLLTLLEMPVTERILEASH